MEGFFCFKSFSWRHFKRQILFVKNGDFFGEKKNKKRPQWRRGRERSLNPKFPLRFRSKIFKKKEEKIKKKILFCFLFFTIGDTGLVKPSTFLFRIFHPEKNTHTHTHTKKTTDRLLFLRSSFDAILLASLFFLNSFYGFYVFPQNWEMDVVRAMAIGGGFNRSTVLIYFLNE